MIGLCLLAYVVTIGPPNGQFVQDSFLRDGVRPCDFERLTVKAKSGKTHLDCSGTGFFVTSDGFLLTNHHVIDEAEEIVVIQQDRAYRAEVVSRNKKKDLALLKINLFPRTTNGVTVVVEHQITRVMIRGQEMMRNASGRICVTRPNDRNGELQKLRRGTLD